MSELAGYITELGCDFPQWWRFNIFMIIVSFDISGKVIDYRSHVDKVYETGNLRDEAPAGYAPGRRTVLATPPCDHIVIYLYVMANTFPSSDAIRNSPPFSAELKVTSGDGKVHTKNLDVNQWGGCTLVEYRIPAE